MRLSSRLSDKTRHRERAPHPCGLRQGEAEECAQETYREVSLAQGRRCAQRRIYPEAEQGASGNLQPAEPPNRVQSATHYL